MSEITPEIVKAAAFIMGQRGGRKGGPARAAKLSPERRQEIARNAAKARWNKQKSSETGVQPPLTRGSEVDK